MNIYIKSVLIILNIFFLYLPRVKYRKIIKKNKINIFMGIIKN